MCAKSLLGLGVSIGTAPCAEPVLPLSQMLPPTVLHPSPPHNEFTQSSYSPLGSLFESKGPREQLSARVER